MGRKPLLTLDTSAINRLADDSETDALLMGIPSGFSVRLAFTSLEEIVATSRGERRDALQAVWKRLLSSGDCLLPFGELLRKVAQSFENSSQFDFASVDVRLSEAEELVAHQSLFGDEVSGTVWKEAREMNRRFDKVFAKVQPAFDKVFEANPAARLGSVNELMSGFKKGGQYWELANCLYRGLGGHPAEESALRKFNAVCPPFMALTVSLCVALYDRNVR